MRNLTIGQQNVVIACVLSWLLDAFDFFILVFVLTAISKTFSTTISGVSFALVLTLAFRPVGAFIFGRLSETYGRKPILMINIFCFSLLEFLSAFSPNLTVFLALRLGYGIMMGGIWGVASALAMETVPHSSRGFISGLFQAGYPAGYLLGAVVNYFFLDWVGWRGLFVIGSLPVFLVIFIYYKVNESPVWLQDRFEIKSVGLLKTLKTCWPACIFSVLLMACFNFFSHGTQDLYPTFLELNHGFTIKEISTVAIAYNIAAILGGIGFGSLSEYIGRRQAIILAAILTIPIIPLWAFGGGFWSLSLGAFLIQFTVQGAWGVVPAYLNELMPSDARATLSGVVYQTGNLLASVNGVLQPYIAERLNNQYSIALAAITSLMAFLLIIMMLIGKRYSANS